MRTTPLPQQHVQRPRSDVIDEINRNMTASEAPATASHVSQGRSSASIRHRGGSVVHAALTTDPKIPERNILFRDPNPRATQLRASHPMFPPGSYNGAGGRHGALQWAQFDPHGHYWDSQRHEVTLAARLGGGFPHVTRTLGLTGLDTLTISTAVTNIDIALRKEPLPDGLGEHTYFRLPDDIAPSELLFNGEKPGKRMLRDLETGKTSFINGPRLTLVMGETALQLSAKVTLDGENWDDVDTQWWLWQDPETPTSFCAEAVAGGPYAHASHRLYVPKDSTAELTTTIQLLAAPL